MKVLLAQVDGKLPNLALMKISSYHKQRGDTVALQKANPEKETFAAPFEMLSPDKVYVSCVFSKNMGLARRICKAFPNHVLGGPGLYRPNKLPTEIEHLMPDYSLYPENDRSMGFTSRGCIRNCGFCIVPQIEGCYREYAPISEFHHPGHDKIILWDNNILAGRDTLKEKFDYIHDHGVLVSLNQGLDARLTTPEVAGMLADLPCYNLSFQFKTWYFSWDLMDNEDQIIQGFQNAIDAGIPDYRIVSYVLVGYNTTHKQDLYRFNKLREFKIDPFIMVYNNRKDDPWIRHFARWVNRRIYKSCDYTEYNDGILREI